MSSKHIDFVAIFFLAVTLLAFSRLSSLQAPDLGDSIRFHQALVNMDSCPTTRQVLALFR